MGELLNRWIAGLACYYLVYAIVMNVIPRKEYRVYVKTFMGLLLIVLLLTPVQGLFGKTRDFASFFWTEEMKRAWNEIRLQGKAGLNETKDQYFRYACQEEIAGQIETLAENMGCSLEEAKVELKEEEEITVKSIEITPKSGAAEKLQGKLAQVYGIGKGDIHVNPAAS